MLNLNDFFLFVQVVDRGGFTAASSNPAGAQIDAQPPHPAA